MDSLLKKIHIELIQPSGKTVDLLAESIIIPGTEGDFEVLADHTPFVTKIRPGTIYIHVHDKTEKYAIHDGFVTIDDNKVVIVCELCEPKSMIDLERAKSAKERAEKRLFSDKDENTDYRRAEVALHKAVARINTLA